MVKVRTGEKEDEEGDQRDTSAVTLWNIETEACGKQCPGHVREREQQEVASSKRIYCLNQGQQKIFSTYKGANSLT